MIKKESIMLAALMMSGVSTLQAKDLHWCVYDVAGSTGNVMQLMKDYVVAAKSWGIQITTQVYQNDELAVQAYLKKQCDAVVASNFATKRLNNFTGTIGAVGLIPNHQIARSLFLALGHPSNAKHMIADGHEVIGWLPIGSAYFMVKDRKFNSITHLTGHSLGVLKYDRSQERMARRIGAIPVPMTFENAGKKFIGGDVDVLAAPIYAYQPLELHKALGVKGGVVNFPIVYISLNFIIRQGVAPKTFGQQSRDWFTRRTPQMMQNVVQWEKTLPMRYWYDVPISDRSAYQRLVTQLRKEFIDSQIYDPEMTNMVLRLHCQNLPTYFECKP